MRSVAVMEQAPYARPMGRTVGSEVRAVAAPNRSSRISLLRGVVSVCKGIQFFFRIQIDGIRKVWNVECWYCRGFVPLKVGSSIYCTVMQ